ncbi:uncharacterized protein LOC130740143 [Lotus japonicus]|uniref:uncharacterized protein LOC130740143 n=1 Tax=Lotus japonicus TaxID=34305 RepID=UPI002584D6FC|nr:uncharacterized protein LOC130740143 [Lotus japonicus]
MALYIDEEEVWKCTKHPSKRRKTGICATCLRDRLVILCPDCATVRPCSCSAATSSSSSSSGDGTGSVGKVNNLIEKDPGLRRSRSLAIPFLRSRSRFSGGDRVLDPGTARESPAVNGSRSARSFWSMFKPPRSNKGSESEHGWDVKKVLAEELDVDGGDASQKAVMARSRSVAVFGGDGELRPRTKGRGWSFPSPMKVFRQSKASKVVQERSPLYRG